jgi:hypothetical protein
VQRMIGSGINSSHLNYSKKIILFIVFSQANHHNGYFGAAQYTSDGASVDRFSIFASNVISHND